MPNDFPKMEISQGTDLFVSTDSTSAKMNKFKYEELVALTSYCLSSLTITLLNKAVLSSSNFGMNFLLLAIQAVSSVLLLAGFKAAGAIDFKPLRKQESIQCKLKAFYDGNIKPFRVTC
jgi:hypothetical protein